MRNEFIRASIIFSKMRTKICGGFNIYSMLDSSILPTSTTFHNNEKWTEESLMRVLNRPRNPKISRQFVMSGDFVTLDSSEAIPVIISSEAEAEAICQRALTMKAIGIDCEGSNLSRKGRIYLVQICLGREVYLFDLECLEIASKIASHLQKVLENPSVVKVMHDCRMDSDALYHQFNIKLQNVFDTQVNNSCRAHKQILLL